MSALITILNGPNLNLLGQREPEKYGATTLADIEAACFAQAQSQGHQIEFLQSNYEGQIIDWIHAAREKSQGIVINPAAFTHTSVAILDALYTFDGPVLEVHITNVHQREEFRHHSFVSKRATGVIAGFGASGYRLAVQHMAELLD
ncbi:type II 3-dehydroquinate dehydratase [Algirhabdus cladophorae]|uniref:type II 3-dehydroquinate dehydratase n=1 Tax=Algirhabdus cladophorae TaxID=3377108 RepID=UPI003B847BE9